MQEATPAQLAQALELCVVVVGTLRPDGLTRPTACTDWTVRQLVNHVVATTSKFSDFAEARTDSPRTPRGDLLGTHPRRAFLDAVTRSRTAWERADLRRTCRLPFGEFSAGQAAAINLFDALVHVWDLASAVAEPLPPPSDELVQIALCVAEELVTPAAVDAGFYRHPEQAAPAASAWDALLLRTGRRPVPLR